MEATKDEWKVIDIGQTTLKHTLIIPSLLAAHALSGCDNVPQLIGIGKKTVFKHLKVLSLTKLGQENVSIEDVLVDNANCSLHIVMVFQRYIITEI